MSLTIHGQLKKSKPLPDIAKEMLLANFSNFSEKFVKQIAGNESLIDKIYNLWIDQTHQFPAESDGSNIVNLSRPMWFKKAVTQYGIGRAIESCLNDTYTSFSQKSLTDHKDALFYCGIFFEYGIGSIETDLKKAESYYERAANAGSERAKIKVDHFRKKRAEGLYYLGMYREKQGKPIEETIHYYREAAALGHQLSIQKLETYFLFHLEKAKGRELFAYRALGDCYKKGQGIPENHKRIQKKKAFAWYAKAANNGDAVAQYQLGLCYERDFGVPKDERKNRLTLAFSWFSKAAHQGNAKAQYSLGVCYEFNRGVPEDQIQEKSAIAFDWYSKSAEQGNANAQYRLGSLYVANPNSSEEIQAKGFKLLESSAESGDAKSQYLLGKCYEKGIGTEKNDHLAFEWYTLAAHQGDAGAQYVLGTLYAVGPGIPDDQLGLRKTLAFHWMQKAAEAKHSEAQYCLGYFYQKGVGVERNLVMAKKWFKKAARKGSPNAQNQLDKIKNRHAARKDNDPEAMYRLGLAYEKDENGIKSVKWFNRAAQLGHSASLGKIEKAQEEIVKAPLHEANDTKLSVEIEVETEEEIWMDSEEIDLPPHQDNITDKSVDDQKTPKNVLKKVPTIDSTTHLFNFFDYFFERLSVSGKVVSITNKYLAANDLDQHKATAAFIDDHYSWKSIYKSWLPSLRLLLNIALDQNPYDYLKKPLKGFLLKAFDVYWDEICSTMIIAAINGHDIDDKMIRAEIIGCIVLGNAWKVPYIITEKTVMTVIVSQVVSNTYLLSSSISYGIIKAQDIFLENIPVTFSSFLGPLFKKQVTPLVCNAVFQNIDKIKLRYAGIVIPVISYGTSYVMNNIYDRLTADNRHPYTQAVHRFGGARAKPLTYNF